MTPEHRSPAPFWHFLGSHIKRSFFQVLTVLTIICFERISVKLEFNKRLFAFEMDSVNRVIESEKILINERNLGEKFRRTGNTTTLINYDT